MIALIIFVMKQNILLSMATAVRIVLYSSRYLVSRGVPNVPRPKNPLRGDGPAFYHFTSRLAPNCTLLNTHISCYYFCLNGNELIHLPDVGMDLHIIMLPIRMTAKTRIINIVCPNKL